MGKQAFSCLLVALSHAMGVQGSILESPVAGYLKDEYNRDQIQSADKQGKIYLHQIQQIQTPQDCALDLHHIATLWKLDRDHDGSVTYEELMAFAEFVNERRRSFGALDFLSKLKAQCVVDLWEVIRDERGETAFAEWICKLACQGDASR